MSKRNAGYPVGGSLPFAMRLTRRFKELGGELMLKGRVKTIRVENGKAVGVDLEDGRSLDADHVIGAADAHSTLYGMLQGRYLTPRMQEAFATWKTFTPLVHVCFGIDRVVPALHATTTVLDVTDRIGRTTLRTGFNVLNYGFDPTLAPKGKTSIIMRFDSPWEIWKDLDGEAYQEEKRVILEEMTSRLVKLYPEVEGHIEVTDVATPRTDVRYTGVWQGAYEGFLPGPDNLNQQLEMRIPGLDGFTLIGQWVFPGGGLPPAAQSGRWAIQLLCKEMKREFRTELAPSWR
jgi:phytoene dehydrogenase-like protein